MGRIRNGVFKLEKIKYKVIATLILTFVMLIDINPFFLKAGRESLICTYEDGILIPYAFDNYHNSYSYYSITKLGGHIAYCMDYNIKNVPNGTGLEYIKNAKSDKLVTVLANGYPNKSAMQLGLANNNEAYLATQMAIWSVLNGNSDTKGMYFDVNRLQANLKYSLEVKELFNNAKKATNDLLKLEYNSDIFYIDSSLAKIDYKYSDSKLKIGPYKLVLKGNYNLKDNINVNISSKNLNVSLIDEDGIQKSNFSKENDIYLLADRSDNIENLKLIVKCRINKYIAPIYGKENFQNFVFLDSVEVEVQDSIVISCK